MAKSRTEPAVTAWEQQPGESTPAYVAFQAYLAMGDKRSIRAVAQELGKSCALIQRWSAAWDWVDRVTAHDRHLASERQKGADRAAREAGETWERRRLEHAERAWVESQKMMEKASLLIGMPVTTRTVSADGKKTIIEAIPPHALRAAAAIIKDAALLGWTAIHEALPDETDFDPKEATTEELREIVARAGRRR